MWHNLHMKIVFLSLIILYVFQAEGFTEVYKYTDKSGNLKFTDTPPSYDPEGMEIIKGTVTQKSEVEDLKKKLYELYPPRNKIEEATLAAVKITSGIGTGSGFFISGNGHILTNRHVILGDELQDKKAEERFDDIESKIRYTEKQFAFAEQKLEQDGAYLEQIRSEIESLPDESARRQYLENRYQTEMEECDARKERYAAEKQKFEAWKEKYRIQKSDYNSQVGVDQSEIPPKLISSVLQAETFEINVSKKNCF